MRTELRRWLRCAVFTALAAAAAGAASAQPLVYVTDLRFQPDISSALTIINPATGHVVGRIPLGRLSEAQTTFVVASADGRRAYVAAGPDMVIVDTVTGDVERVTLGGDLGPLALTADGGRLFVASRSTNSVLILDTGTRQLDGNAIPLASSPIRLALAPDGSRLYVLGAEAEQAVYVADTAARTVTSTIVTHASPIELLVHPDGTRLYVAHSLKTTADGGDSLTAYQAVSGVEIASVVLPDARGSVTYWPDTFPVASHVGQMAIPASGTRIYVPRLSAASQKGGAVFRNEAVDVLDAESLEVITRVVPPQTNPDLLDSRSIIGAAAGPDGQDIFTAGGGGVAAISVATHDVRAAGSSVESATSMTVAPAPPCWFEVFSPPVYVRGAGGIGQIQVPAPPDGCSWTATPSADWIQLSTTTGSVPATITIQIGSSDTPRSGWVAISGQRIIVEQLIPHTVIDGPADGASVSLPFTLFGWAIERSATELLPGAFDHGVGSIHVWDQTAGEEPRFLGFARSGFGTGTMRLDVEAVYGHRYRFSGFSLLIARLRPGVRTLAVYAQSLKDGAFYASTVTVTVRREPVIGIDPVGALPTSQPGFTLSGYGLDRTVLEGCGVDAVHVWAYPHAGGDPRFVGAATVGINRPDLAAPLQESLPFTCGWQLAVPPLPTGVHTLVAYGHFSATGSFDAEASVQVTVQNGPFGVVDTPAPGAVVAGTIGITGWALDDIGVVRVAVFRNPAAGEVGQIYVGDATFVEGARPDVAAAYPGYPGSTRAGWGLSVLTNLLPNGGNGLVVFYIKAYDAAGNETVLATRGVTVANAASVLPFGTIDTPGQGATVSGTVAVFGWALTPGPNIIPLDGSTIEIIVDGVVVGHPTFNQCRGTNGMVPAPGTCNDDIATLFGSTYRNISEGSGAILSFLLDTTTLTNGIHSIEMRVTDSGGNVQGMGSRFFYVQEQLPASSLRTILIDVPAEGATLTQPFEFGGWAAHVRLFGEGPGVATVHVWAYPAGGGDPVFIGESYGRPRSDIAALFGSTYLNTGYQVTVNGLPPGTYTFAAFGFDLGTGGFSLVAQRTLTIVGQAPFGVVDTPAPGASVAGTIGVTGWALDDFEVTRVAVFRDPIGSELEMIWVGDAVFVDGARPDVAAAYPTHRHNTRAGWGLSVQTNMLPNGGNGPITFHVYAYDAQGPATLLGSRSVTGTNDTSVLPFGTIDMPGQGATVSGTVAVFG